MTARTAYGLDTPRGFHWAERAACSPANGAVDVEWWWPPSGQAGPDTMRALHICRAHCPVRPSCHREAVEVPPEHPCVLGGRRYVMRSGGSGRVVPSQAVDDTTSAGCPYCTDTTGLETA